MYDRRKFAKQLFASVPATTGLTWLAQNANGQQPAPVNPPARPPAGKGQMDGSPLGDPLPGQKWRVHDRNRPQPRKVIPGLPMAIELPPSDAIVLFDGKNLSQWNGTGRGGAITEPRWKVENGYVEMVPGSGGMITKQKFGDIQLHLEWITPTGADPSRVGQQRGNSGVILMGHYEIQVLSSFDNPTYPDGGAGSIYGMYPPMVNPCRPEGEWNSYDIIFESPSFEGERVVKRACVTLIFNGVLVHHRVELLGSTAVEPIAQYQPHPPEEPFSLQAHAGPVRYRNIWVRRLLGYDA
jgi:hypothetical protein